MEGELALFVLDCMACIAASLESDDHVITLGKEIYHAALSFVSPINSYYCTI